MADAARDGALASPGQAQEPPDAAEASSSQAQPVVDAADVETVSEDSSQLRQQPNCEGTERPDQTPAGHAASSIAALAAASGPLALRRVASSGPAAPRGVTFGIGAGIGLRSRSRSGGDDGDRASSELVLQLQRLCRRQRQRSEERAFVRDVERVLALLRVQTPAPSGSAATSATYPGPGLSLTESNPGELLRSVQEEDGGADEEGGGLAGTTSLVHSDRFVGCDAPTLAEIDALLDCIADLFEHRNPSVRSLAFEVVQLCLLRFGERLTPALRRKVFLRLETHTPGDFLLRQKALRALTQDGRHLQPFHVELGWLLLNLLEESDAQRDLLGLIQCIFRRSPRALDRDKVIAIVSIISSRCELPFTQQTTFFSPGSSSKCQCRSSKLESRANFWIRYKLLKIL
ncbi:Tuberous sclerosis 2-like protein [Phytophthora boehmeriae]|uniref:Tuberous sclerosis 2-like protein n=1 Tax=Phytophthora boehmeriae TaxID=109152 RepID=A0A8T1W857_9STRA|nr:Tuberous sclerosis 2-like protein [Phytophthora boehmeriae]